MVKKCTTIQARKTILDINIKRDALKCKHCEIKCPDLIVSEKHMIQEHKFKCEMCTTVFQEESQLDNHMTYDH